MPKIFLFDPSIMSDNFGDQIIANYCKQQLESIFYNPCFFTAPTHELVGRRAHRFSKMSDYRFVCGTNLIMPRLIERKQWKLHLYNVMNFTDICLMGVGWNNYDINVDPYTRFAYNRILSTTKIHSVRDSFTEKAFKRIGISNVINTSCPSLWNISQELCSKIPTKKGDTVVTTLTNYRKNPVKDSYLVNSLINNYKTVFFWPQNYEDLTYLESIIDISKIQVLGYELKNYSTLLEENPNLDYVGTRLHAGILALNHGIRSTIIAVDNRASEISKDTHLNVINRNSIEDKIDDVINSCFSTEIILPIENIAIWKEQFR